MNYVSNVMVKAPLLVLSVTVLEKDKNFRRFTSLRKDRVKNRGVSQS
jgi:hypothetical protein